MKFLRTRDGNYINSMHILRLSWDAGGDVVHTDEGDEHTLPGVYAELFDGEIVPLVYFDEDGGYRAKRYLDELVAKLNSEELNYEA